MGCSNVRQRGVIVAIGRSLFAAILLLSVAGRMPDTVQAAPPTAAEVKKAKDKATDALKASSEATEAASAFKAEMATSAKEAAADVAKEKSKLAETAKQDAVKANKKGKAAAETKAENAQEEADKAADTAAQAKVKELDAKAAHLKLIAKHAADEAKAIEANISSPKTPPFPQAGGVAAAPAAPTLPQPGDVAVAATLTPESAAELAVAAAPVAQTPEADAVFVIIAAHTTDTQIGGGATKNVELMTKLLNYQTKSKADIVPLIDGDFTHNNILNTINQLPVNRRINGQAVNPQTATVFLYIACHGATLLSNGQHVVQVPSATGNIFVQRTTYLNALKSKGVRQVVMITDTCSTSIDSAAAAGIESTMAADAIQQTNALGRLLLHQSGVFDFGGSRPPQGPRDRGEFGAYYNSGSAIGGLFTRAFFDAALFADTDHGWQSILDYVDQQNGNVLIQFAAGTVPPTQDGQHTFAFPVQ